MISQRRLIHELIFVRNKPSLFGHLDLARASEANFLYIVHTILFPTVACFHTFTQDFHVLNAKRLKDLKGFFSGVGGTENGARTIFFRET